MRPPFLNLVSAKYPAWSENSTPSERPKLGKLLLASGAVSEDDIKDALHAQTFMDTRIGDYLCAEAGLSRTQLSAVLARQWNAREINLTQTPPDPDIIRQLGLSYCLEHGLLPWRRIGGATVVAVSNPAQVAEVLPHLESVLGPVMVGICSEVELQQALAQQFPVSLNAQAETRAPILQSCRQWRGKKLRIALIVSLLLMVVGTLVAPSYVAVGLMGLAFIALLAQNTLKALATFAALRRDTPDAWKKVVTLHGERTSKLPVVSILVPLLHEEDIVDSLVSRLERLTYPKALLDVCLVTEADDEITAKTLSQREIPNWIRVIEVPSGTVMTKPKALNYALDFCRGKIIGIYDAEDKPEPDQISQIVTRFDECAPNVACLQGRLAFYNAGYNWLSRCFATDYATWFALVLPGVAKMGLVVPLGGTTLFFRRDVLEEIGAWDAHNVTEDADLGLRLARCGYRTELIATTTLEEANCNAKAWIRQRSRWLKGYAMTYATHMRDPLALLRDLGPKRFLGVQVMFLGTLVQALLAPVIWSWWLILLGLPHPASALLSTKTILIAALVLFSIEVLSWSINAVALIKTGQRRLLPWVPLMNPYNMMATAAIIKALVEMIRKPFYWDKTSHGIYERNADADALTTDLEELDTA